MNTQQIVALNDPNFPDMANWLNTLLDSSAGSCNTVGGSINDALVEEPTGVEEHLPMPASDHDETMIIDNPDNEISPDEPDMHITQPTPTPIMTPTTIHEKRARSRTPPTSVPAKRAKTAVEDCRSGLSRTVSPTSSKSGSSLSSISSKVVSAAKGIAKKTSTTANKVIGTVGISRSAVASRKLKADMEAGIHVVSKVKHENFEESCRLVDRRAQFRYEGKQWKVFHLGCGKWQMMKEAYNVGRFEEHVKGCKKSGTGKFTTLGNFFAPKNKQANRPAGKTISGTVIPCSGIMAHHDARVHKTVHRTGADGGGARSVTAIATELFGEMYSDLSKWQQTRVDTKQMHEWTFRLDRKHVTIYSTACEKSVMVSEESQGPHACPTCLRMLQKDTQLKSAMRQAMPKDENFKHLNEKYCGKADSERYAKVRGLQSLFEDNVSLSFR